MGSTAKGVKSQQGYTFTDFKQVRSRTQRRWCLNNAESVLALELQPTIRVWDFNPHWRRFIAGDRCRTFSRFKRERVRTSLKSFLQWKRCYGGTASLNEAVRPDVRQTEEDRILSRRFAALLVVCALLWPSHGRADAKLGAFLGSGYPMAFDHWDFQFGLEFVDVSRDPAINVGLSYGPIGFLSSTTVGLSCELTYMQFRTDVTPISQMPGAAAEFEARVLPVLFWGTLGTPGEFGPFVRAGLGATRIYWSSTFGLAAGIRYRPSQRIEFWAYGEDLLAFREEAGTRSNGQRTGFLSDPNFDSFNIRVIIWM